MNEDVSVVLKPGEEQYSDSSQKDPKTNGLPRNTFINLCKLLPEWVLKVQRADELSGKIK